MSRLVLLLGLVSSAAVYLRGDWEWSALVLLATLLLGIVPNVLEDRSGGWVFIGELIASAAIGGVAGLYVDGTQASFAFGAGIGLTIFGLGATAGFLPGVALYRVLDDGWDQSISRYIAGFLSSSLSLPWWLDEILFGSFRGIQVIRNGYVAYSVPHRDSMHMLGPCLVIIGAGNAAVFERSGPVTRVKGPGVVLTKRFETLREIVDLRLQTTTLDEIRAETRDGIHLGFHPTIQYRVEINEDELAEKGTYTFDETTIRRAALGATNWKAQTECTATRIICEVAGCYALDDLYEPAQTSNTPPLSSVREVLHSEIMSRLNAA